ncbi:sensor histidine kinase [Dyella tabacisoli]|uniref:ATPase n=1 Tax=Dyella tabacisoli TaxID=2282381 RepID=A0A369UU11_9GAMM|nr:sensor histidine kinase [Dyella tabacisoli]RDD83090.1 ATPase [Dyella tabacisoli]
MINKRTSAIGYVFAAVYALVLSISFACPVFAAEANRDSGLFHHSTWTLKDGAPADIWAMIQGKDGYLWLGTGSGLYRFDGVKFERFELPSGERLPSNNITALTQLPNGDLWIGFFSGGACVIKGDRMTNYALQDGFPEAMVFAFAQDRDGTLWAATSGGLVRFEGGRWQVVGKDWNFPVKRADWLLLDADGTLWVTTGETMVFLRKGSRQFERTGIETGRYAILARAPNGLLWISDNVHGTRPLPGLSAVDRDIDAGNDLPRTAFAHAKRMLFDDEGQLWATDANRGGVYQLAAPERNHDGHAVRSDEMTEVFNRQNGLPSDIAVPVLQDREGTIWVGSNLGLSSFRRNSVGVLKDLSVVGPSSGLGLTADSQGVVWIANRGTLYRMDHTQPVAVMHGLPDVQAVLEGERGVLWLSGLELLRVADGRSAKIPLFDSEPYTKRRAMTSDRQGGLWVSSVDRGVFHFSAGKWSPWRVDPKLTSLIPGSIAMGTGSDVWFGYSDSRVAVFDGTAVRSFSSRDGLQIGNITVIDPTRAIPLVGGESGLARFYHGRFQSIPSQTIDAFSGISGIIQLENGDVWLNTSKGVVRIFAKDFQHAFDHPGERFDYRLFDYQDGLPGVALQANETPTVAVDSDRRLWFVTNQGVAWIDPAKIRSNMVPPPVAIRSLTAMGRSYMPSAVLTLPERTTNVRIEYTAMSLSIPERVQFRYKLDGVDDQWQDAGHRREAFYTNLEPGAYHFSVIAANDDGLWNRQGASIDFTITPMFFQTRWFTVLCVLVGLALLLMLFLLRLRQMTMLLHDRLEERHAERERIARELHDTLLQAVQGLVLRFQAVAERIPARDPIRLMIDKALDRADDVLIEGRDRVRDLRTTAETIRDLPRALALVGEELAQDYPVAFRVIVGGATRVLNPIVREEIYRIGREALLNAFQHAKAHAIEVEIDHATDHLRLRVRDDGQGIDPIILEHGRKPGHWGLAGMRERATRIGATLDIWAGAGSGTEVDLRVPAHAVYCDGNRSWLNWLRRIVSGGRYT